MIFWRLARRYLPRFLLTGLLAAGTELAGLALMGTATYLLVRAADQPPLSALTVAIVAVRALAIGRGTLRYTERLAGHDATLRVVTEVRTRIYAALVTSRGTRHSGDLLSRLVSDVDAVQDMLLRCLVPAAAALVVSVAAVTGAGLLSPGAGVALAAGLLFAGGLLPAVAMLLARRGADQVAPLRGALAADAVDLTRGAADLAAYGATGPALLATAARTSRLAAMERRLAVAGWAVDGAGTLLAGLTAAAVTVAALRSGTGGTATAVLAVASLVAVESVLALVTAARRWVEIRQSLRRVADLLGAGGDDLSPMLARGRGTGVELVGVTVRHREAAALDAVDLRVRPGHTVAVLGPSGAGKSTLLGVAAGLVRPDEGEVHTPGVPTVSGLLADAHVFHATVRENLTLGRPDVPEADLVAAVEVAGLGDWIREQPDGWDTVVGEDGGALSGGQRQRLALARAVLAAPEVLLLDEPTEGLDPRAADRVLASVLAAAERSAVILVTHRLAGLERCDEIVVLDAGRVVQRGRHADLVEAPGWYREQRIAQDAVEHGYLGV